MADNFDMKKFLVENKLGAYSKLKNEGEAAYEYEKGKAAGEKEEKEKLAKEDYAGAEEEKMMDFLAEEEPLKEDASAVMDILGFLAGLAGMGLTATQILSWQNKLEKENPELYKQLGQVSTTIGGADPSKNLEEKKEEVKEALSPEAFERMDGLVSQSDIMEYLRAAERIVNTLSDEGFEARDIFDYLYQIVINDL